MENKICLGIHIYNNYKEFMGFSSLKLNLDCPRCWADKAVNELRESINQSLDTKQPNKD